MESSSSKPRLLVVTGCSLSYATLMALQHEARVKNVDLCVVLPQAEMSPESVEQAVDKLILEREAAPSIEEAVLKLKNWEDKPACKPWFGPRQSAYERAHSNEPFYRRLQRKGKRRNQY